MDGEDDIKLPPPAPELLKDEAFKAQENEFLAELFDNERLDRNKPAAVIGDPDIVFPEDDKKEDEKPATPPAGDAPPAGDQPPVAAPAAAAPKEGDVSTDALLPGTEPAPSPTPAPTATTPAAAPAAPSTPTPTPATIDTDALADKVADRLRPKPAPAPDPLAAFNDEDKEELRVLQALNKNPKYAGRDLVKETTEFWNKESEYIANWKRNNPGKKFESDDDEHTEFYESATPAIPEKDITNAHIALQAEIIADQRAEQKVREQLAPIQEKLAATEREALEIKVKPLINESVNQSVATLAVEAVPEFKEIVKDGKLTPDVVNAMKEHDPAAVEAINSEARSLMVVVAECERMAHLGEHFQFDVNKRVDLKDGDAVRPHAVILETANDIEDRILRGPQDGKIWTDPANGQKRVFITRQMFHAQMEEAEKNNDQRKIESLLNNRWMIGADDVKREIINKSATRVKRVLDIANTRGTAAQRKASPQGGNQPATPPGSKPGKTVPPTPPSMASASDNTDTKVPKAPGAKSPEKIIEESFFS